MYTHAHTHVSSALLTTIDTHVAARKVCMCVARVALPCLMRPLRALLVRLSAAFCALRPPTVDGALLLRCVPVSAWVFSV